MPCLSPQPETPTKQFQYDNKIKNFASFYKILRVTSKYLIYKNTIMTDVKDIWLNYKTEIRAYIVRRMGNQTFVDDIVQEVFLKIINNRQRISNVENIQEYLYKMTKNTIVDNFRSKKVNLVEIDDFELKEEQDYESLNKIISESCVKPFINKLPEKYKEALTYTEIENLSQKEFAKKIDISYSGAKSRVQRGKEKLKDLLQECCNFESDNYGNLIESNGKNCNC